MLLKKIYTGPKGAKKQAWVVDRDTSGQNPPQHSTVARETTEMHSLIKTTMENTKLANGSTDSYIINRAAARTDVERAGEKQSRSPGGWTIQRPVCSQLQKGAPKAQQSNPNESIKYIN